MSKCSTARTYQFRVRLTRDGRRWLDDRLAAHCRRYNAALQERRDAWRMARRSISFAYGEGYVSIYRVIRPAISVTSTASAGSRATFVVYDCNATNVDRSPGNGGAGLIEIDLQRWPTATLLAVSGPKGISALGRFSGSLRISDARRSWRFHAKTPTFDGIRIQWGSRDIGRLRLQQCQSRGIGRRHAVYDAGSSCLRIPR